MRPEDYPRLEKAMLRLAAVYAKEISPEALQVYIRALRDLPIETIEQRVDSHIRFSKFFPKPVELRPKEDRPPKEKDSASEARFREAQKRADDRLDELWSADHAEWLRQVSPKVYELGRSKGMPDSQIVQKLDSYIPRGIA